MADDGRALSRSLERLGARDAAAVIARGVGLAGADFDRLRAEISGAAGVARSSGQQAQLAAEVRAVVEAGGPRAALLSALLSGDRSRLPAEVSPSAAVAPPVPVVAPPAPVVSPPAPVVSPRAPDVTHRAPVVPPPPPVVPPEPFAVSRSTVVAPDPVVPEAVDGYAWGAVALSALSIVLALQLSIPQALVAVPVVSLCVLGLLLVDRSQLAAAGNPVPGWGWALLPPAYLFRRGRALGQRPVQAYALVGVGMATRVALVVFGVSVGGGPLGDLSALETVLEAEYAATWQQPVTADCPRFVEITRGTEFDCLLEAADGTSRIELTFRVADDDGAVEQIRSFTGPTASSGTVPADAP